MTREEAIQLATELLRSEGMTECNLANAVLVSRDMYKEHGFQDEEEWFVAFARECPETEVRSPGSIRIRVNAKTRKASFHLGL